VLGLRPQYAPGHVADPALLVGPHADDGDSGGGGEAVDLRGSARRVIDSRRLDFADLAALEQAGEAVDVVGMEVGEDREGNVGDIEPPGTCVLLGGIGAGVHGDGRVRGEIQEHAVALADVADGERPRCGRAGRGGRELADEGDGTEADEEQADEEQQAAAIGGHTGLRRSWIRCSERVSLRPMA
jgi:hypothetical protein